jgi:hypothetical protein
MIDLLSELIERAESIAVVVVAVMAFGMVLVTWAKTRSSVRTLSAVIVGLVLTWAVNEIDVLDARTDEDIVDRSGHGDPAARERNEG